MPVSLAGEGADYDSASDAYRKGLSAYRSGSTEQAVSALTFAAARGILGAQLKLAQIYSAGQGVTRNDEKAFVYFRQVADEYADLNPRHPAASYVADAFIALGRYYRTGVPAMKLSANPVHAFELFLHAASYFGAPAAQFELARLYLDGEGVPKNPRLAVNWLTNAAKKDYAPAQAVLGDLLWRGGDDLARQPVRGLALLSVARLGATEGDQAQWIAGLYARAAAEARPEQKARASELALQWQGRWKAHTDTVSLPETAPGASGSAGQKVRTAGQTATPDAAGAATGIRNVEAPVPAGVR